MALSIYGSSASDAALPAPLEHEIFGRHGVAELHDVLGVNYTNCDD